jgi:hypothetical protein
MIISGVELESDGIEIPDSSFKYSKHYDLNDDDIDDNESEKYSDSDMDSIRSISHIKRKDDELIRFIGIIDRDQ